jgi:hypothetical protein
MCYSLRLSALSLTVGLLGCYLLIRYSSISFANTNKAIGIFFAFVFLMQLIEMMMWSDQSCKSGLNRIASLLGPLFNHLQPVILLLLAIYYIPSANVIPNSILYLLNFLYVFYVVVMYGKYVKDERKHGFCTRTNSEGHLDWLWKRYFNYTFYFAILIINAINYYKNGYLMVALIASFGLLYLSTTNFKKNIGEGWCISVVSVPYIILVMQKMIEK